MPELPEVETVRRGLEQRTRGFTIQRAAVLRSRAVASPTDPAVFIQALQGCKECQKKLSGGRKKFEEEELQRVREQQKYDEEERLITEQEDREEQAILTNQSIDDFIVELGIWSISNDEDERDGDY